MTKAKKLWEVAYEERSKGSSDWTQGDQELWVLADNAEAASDCVRRHRLNKKWDWTDDDGEEHTETVVAVRLTKIEYCGEIDLVAR